ncbi:MAG: hypothetical protein R6V75_05560 [Bacteroidales bacterium]
MENFHPDSISHREFLAEVAGWVNHKLGHLDTLRPAVPSPFIPDALVRIRVDTIYFIADQRAWDASFDVEAPYIRERYVDNNKQLDYRQKYQTLPVFIAGNHPVAGGHSMGIGTKWYIAVRGYYHQYLSLPRAEAVEECAKNLIHELGHCLGLLHNFRGGPHGEQCDFCEDNGCPEEGTSNNIMDYWPGFGHALSGCQFDIIQSHIRGERGDISEVVINDSCFLLPGSGIAVPAGSSLVIADTTYAHGDCIVGEGGTLRVTGYLSVPMGCSLHLEPGATLEIDGGAIGNLCGELWAGIRIGPQPAGRLTEVALVNGGALINASTALLVGGRANIQLEEARFLNCVYGIVVDENLVNELLIDRCHFLIDSRINQYEEGAAPGGFVDFKGGSLVTVQSSRFANEKGTFLFDADHTGTGLTINQASLVVRNSEFLNLSRAVQVAGTFPWQRIRMTGNDFTHNRCAIHAYSQGIMVVDSNNFTLQRFNERTTFGILLEQPERVVVAGNQMTSQFGGGSMAGIVLRRPAARSALIARNIFERLPVGIVVDQPPPVDSLLLKLAVDQQFHYEELMAGPQFPENRFEEVPLALAILDGAAGTTIGLPAESPVRVSNPLQRPVGGFTWLNHQMPLGAVDVPGTMAPVIGHGFYQFINYLNINKKDSFYHFLSDVADSSRNQEAASRVVGDYLLDYHRFWRDVLPGEGRDIFKLLVQLERTPAILRSGYLAPFGVHFRVEEEDWLRGLLAGMAGTFTQADSLLAWLAVEQSEANARAWVTEVIENQEEKRGKALQGAADLPPLADLPALTPFRIAVDANVPGGTPAFRLWPVPAFDQVYIHPTGHHRPGPEWQWSLLGPAGQVIRIGRVDDWTNLRVPVGDLPDGTYFIRMTNGATDLGTRAFIKARNN